VPRPGDAGAASEGADARGDLQGSRLTAVLADTNVILRLVVPRDPLAGVARLAIERLVTSGYSVCVSPQNLVEFWSVATRPAAANGLGLTVAQAAVDADRITDMFPMVEDVPSIHEHWRRLVESCGVIGRQAFDARLVAVMRVHDISHLLTFDVGGFRRFPGIAVLDPRDESCGGPAEPP
jgi:predicted nucleic acid-binding protein